MTARDPSSLKLAHVPFPFPFELARVLFTEQMITCALTVDHSGKIQPIVKRQTGVAHEYDERPYSD